MRENRRVKNLLQKYLLVTFNLKYLQYKMGNFIYILFWEIFTILQQNSQLPVIVPELSSGAAGVQVWCFLFTQNFCSIFCKS